MMINRSNTGADSQKLVMRFRCAAINDPAAELECRWDLVAQQLPGIACVRIPRVIRFQPASPADIFAKVKAAGLKLPVRFHECRCCGGSQSVWLSELADSERLHRFALDERDYFRDYFVTEAVEHQQAVETSDQHRAVVVDSQALLLDQSMSDVAFNRLREPLESTSTRLELDIFAIGFYVSADHEPLRRAYQGVAGIEVVTVDRRFPEVIRTVKELACDVLFYSTVGDDLLSYVLPFYRLTPVQATMIGMHGTSGIPAMDIFVLIKVADVLLDPPYFSGVNASYDSIARGKAAVTHLSQFSRGRFTAGCYSKMRITDHVTSDFDPYASIAVALGTDSQMRRDAELQLQEAGQCLFEDSQVIEQFDALFEKMISRERLN